MDAADEDSDSFKCPLCGNALSTAAYRDVKKKVKADADRAVQEAQRDMEVRMERQLEDAIQDAEKKAAGETLDLKHENQKLIQELELRRKQFDEYKKKQDGRPAWFRGMVGESVLLKMLEEKFPDDDFVKEKPGQETADIIQRINYNGTYLDTPICYDNKDDKQVSLMDTKKAKKYRTIHSTPYVIIVTRVMPAKSNHAITTKDGVLLVHPYIVNDVVSVIRDGIIKIAAAAANAEDRDGKEADLYRYITGDDFSTRVARLFSIRDDLAALQEQEKKEHEKIWKKRAEMLDIMSSQLIDVEDHISKITQGVLQKIKTGRST